MCIAAIDAVLKDQHYDEAKVALQVNYICEDIMAGLVAMRKPFKYVSACQCVRVCVHKVRSSD